MNKRHLQNITKYVYSDVWIIIVENIPLHNDIYLLPILLVIWRK